ncbi:MAG: hypothetical protein N2C12_14755, partial [Planctomycetales bacterium]
MPPGPTAKPAPAQNEEPQRYPAGTYPATTDGNLADRYATAPPTVPAEPVAGNVSQPNGSSIPPISEVQPVVADEFPDAGTLSAPAQPTENNPSEPAEPPMKREFDAEPIKAISPQPAATVNVDPTPVSNIKPPTEDDFRYPPLPGEQPIAARPEFESRDRLPVAEPAAPGTGKPGGRHLEGPQAPNFVIEKISPTMEIQVGKPATFDIRIKNTGTVTAYDVMLHDVVPQGTRLLGTKPKAQPAGGDGLVWSLGNFEPGDEKYIEVQLMPETEGEIGSVASVSFSTRASVGVISTKPKLKIDVTTESQVMIDEQITMNITITMTTNPHVEAAGIGSGTPSAATNVMSHVLSSPPKTVSTLLP